MESLHSDGSATYLLIIWVEKKYTFRNEIETKSIFLNCFSKYINISFRYQNLAGLLTTGQLETTESCGRKSFRYGAAHIWNILFNVS